MHKSLLVAFLTVLIVFGFVLVYSTNLSKVQASTELTTIPKPSIPEFTLKHVDNSYDVPSSTTTTTDPYTGEQTVTTEPGYYVQDKTIEITIKNQEFTPYSIDSQQISLFYYVSRKGHYAEDWSYYPPSTHGREYSSNHILQSNSDYTVVQFSAPPEGEMDFRVQAQIGYYTSTEAYLGVPGAPFTTYTFNGEVSGWSETQTLTIPTPTEPPTSSPAPNPTDTSPPTSPAFTEMEAILGVTIIIAVLFGVLGFLAYLIRRN